MRATYTPQDGVTNTVTNTSIMVGFLQKLYSFFRPHQGAHEKEPGIAIPQTVIRLDLSHVDILGSHAPPYARQNYGSRNVQYVHGFLIFPIISDFRIPAHPSLTFADQIETRIIARLSSLIHSQEYQQSA
jgi:hypothetical protein